MFEFPDDIGTARHEDDVVAILAELKRRALPPEPIAFYGSSSFRLWHTIAADLGNLDVVNLGFGGGTFASGLHYFDKLLAPLRPGRIVLYFGENDISADGLSAEATFAGLRALHQRISNALPTVPVAFLSAKQSPTKWIYSEVVTAFNLLAKEFCEKEPSLQYIDVASVLLGPSGLPMMRYFQNDFIHINALGYSKWAEILRAELPL